jgi:hypothetical protein
MVGREKVAHIIVGEESVDGENGKKDDGLDRKRFW